MKPILIIALSVVAALAAVVVIGLRVQPRAFAPYPQQTPPLETVPLPNGLPAPVKRFYHTISGDRVPVIHSAVITGRGTLRFQGITFPTRVRFIHEAGQGYRHYIEATFWGQPILTARETYLDGFQRFELPFGVVENEPKLASAANQGLWAETLMLPWLFVTDPRVRWEAMDDQTARLIVPFGDEEQTFTVAFDSETGLIRYMETMRWRDVSDTEMIGWRAEVRGWQRLNGMMVPALTAATWADEGTPWLVTTLEEIVYNVEVAEAIRARGP